MDKILNRFQMGNCNEVATPMESGIHLRKVQDSGCQLETDRDLEDRRLQYQCLVGSLIYLMRATWPDLAFTVSTLRKFNAAPTNEHLSAAKRVFR